MLIYMYYKLALICHHPCFDTTIRGAEKQPEEKQILHIKKSQITSYSQYSTTLRVFFCFFIE